MSALGDGRPERPLRIAAAGDVHCDDSNRAHWAQAFARVAQEADLVLLAGDLTTHGDPSEAAILADAVRPIDVPVVVVLGNHDLHESRGEEIVRVVEGAGVTVLDRDWTTCSVRGATVGVAGIKGFVGGFEGSTLPDFGEPLLRRVYAETTAEAEALERGLQAIEECDLRIALLHYAPIPETLEGEPRGIFAFLGCDRLAPPIVRHRPDLVLHGHAHAGTLEGEVAGVPVFNVAVPVMKRDFWLFEVEAAPGEAEHEVLRLRTA
jgi:Icc-related predicted phosphoesterase